jgi:BASS family bile acid:Na+ symporter
MPLAAHLNNGANSMNAAEFIRVLVPLTLIEMMIAVGLSVGLTELAATARNWRLIIRAMLANYLCVPLITVGLLLWVRPPDPMVALGFLILALCPGAPFAPSCTKLAKGDVAASVGLMVILSGSSVIFAPLLLYLELPVLSANQGLRIDAAKIIATLLATQLAPLCVGLAVRHWVPRVADKLLKPANLLNLILNLATLVSVFVGYFSLLTAVRPQAYLGMAVLLAASLVVGWLLGGPGSDNRKAMMLTTSLRNVGVGLVIVTGSFAGTAAVTAVVVYGIVEIVGSVLTALAFGRTAAGTA